MSDYARVRTSGQWSADDGAEAVRVAGVECCATPDGAEWSGRRRRTPIAMFGRSERRSLLSSADVQMPVQKAVQLALVGTRRAVALYDWDSRARADHGIVDDSGGDLRFRAGDILDINPDQLAVAAGGGAGGGPWVAGACQSNGTSGIFPSEWVEMLETYLDEMVSASLRENLLGEVTREKYVYHMLAEHYATRERVLLGSALGLVGLGSFLSFLAVSDGGFGRWLASWSPVFVGWLCASAAALKSLHYALGWHLRAECFGLVRPATLPATRIRRRLPKISRRPSRVSLRRRRRVRTQPSRTG